MAKVTQLIAGIVVLYTGALYPLACFDLLRSPDNKVVLILGETHTYQSTVLQKAFESLLNRLQETSSGRTYLPCIVEFPEYALGELTTSQNASLLASPQKNKELNISCTACDPRPEESTVLNIGFENLAHTVILGVTSQELCAHYGFNARGMKSNRSTENISAESWEEFKRVIKDGNTKSEFPITIGDFFKVLRGYQASIEALIQKYKHSPQISQLFQTALAKFIAAFENIKSRLPSDELRDLFVPICREFLTCTTIEERLTMYDTLHRYFLKDTDSSFADSCFLDKLFETLKKESCACIYVGWAHADALSKELIKLGYTRIARDDTRLCDHPLLISLNPVESFETNLLGAVNSIITHLKENMPRICHSCFKEFDKLSICGKCKQVRYCSSTCQKEDWASHKKICALKSAHQPVVIKTTS